MIYRLGELFCGPGGIAWGATNAKIDNKDFGIDLPEHYGTLIYYDNDGQYHEENVVSERGDYGRVYDDLYEAVIHGKEKTITDEQTLLQMEILEEGIRNLK